MITRRKASDAQPNPTLAQALRDAVTVPARAMIGVGPVPAELPPAEGQIGGIDLKTVHNLIQGTLAR